MSFALTAVKQEELVQPTLKKAAYRIEAIDLLRGLVMVIMALDHTRVFFHTTAWTDDPLNLQTTTPALFFTRWITHFCAPVFVFLAGTSAYLQSLRKSKKELSGFLLKRGLWLILIELVLINFAFSFNIHYGLIALQVIWVIGISMVLLALAIWMPFNALLLTGLLIILSHNALDFFEANHKGNYSIVYALLHQQSIFPLGSGRSLMVMYPFLPWTGLMLMGYCFGKLFIRYEGEQRRKVLTRLSLGIILFFIALRSANLYGNPEHWTAQKNGWYTVLSFIDTNKYPPSLLYMCMTIGPAILFLAWWGNIKNTLTRIITVYGRVPFLYYVLHFFLIHILCGIYFLIRGHSVVQEMNSAPDPNIPFDLPKFIIPSEGLPLWGVYLVWLFVVAVLYPVCRWFSNYKQTHKQWWLSYL